MKKTKTLAALLLALALTLSLTACGGGGEEGTQEEGTSGLEGMFQSVKSIAEEIVTYFR